MMKLLSCYVENYGKIKKQDFHFDNSLIVYCENNGYGKTTLASFIKAMFYGLEGYRSNTKEFCERQHFYPFDGGLFGGNLTFEIDGKNYKIERFFGEKSENQDECTVYCDGKSTDIFGNNIGKNIFGIDAKSFERTIFIDSDKIDISSTASINAKLNNFLDGNEEDADFEQALDILDKKRKEYKKSRNGNDLITETKSKIIELNSAIANVESIKNVLAEKYKKYDDERVQINAFEKQINEAQTQNLVLKDWERYDGFSKAISENLAKIEKIEDDYPFGIPTSDEADNISAQIGEINEMKAKLSQSTFDENDEAKLLKLSMKFSDSIPNEVQLEAIEKDIRQHAALEAEISTVGHSKNSESSAKLFHTFSTHCPDKQEIEIAHRKIEEYTLIQKELSALPNETETKSSGKSNKLFLIIAIIATTVLAVGIGLLFVHSIIGIIVSVICGIALLVDGFFYLNNKTARTIPTDNSERRKIIEKASALSDSIKSLILPFGYNSSNGIIFDFAAFEKDLVTFYEMKKTENDKNKQIEEKESRKRELENALNTFFEKYGYFGDFLRNLTAVKKDIGDYIDLQTRKRKSNENVTALNNEITEKMKPVTDFCKKYHIDFDNLQEKIKLIINDISTISNLRSQVAKDEENAQKFKTEKGLSVRPNIEFIDIIALNETLNNLRDANSRLHREICDDEIQVERLDEYLSAKSIADERLSQYHKTYELLSATYECIKQAEESLKDKYIKPIRDKFIDFSHLLEKTLGEKITMNRDFEISFERNGKERSERHLSAGQRTICAFCFRLALIWNMYESEKPFLILDDPFVSLDEEHLEKAKNLLVDLSKKMQIIYFSCHSSRNII